MNTFVLIGCIMLALSIVILYRSRPQIKVFEHDGEYAIDFRSREMDKMVQRRDMQKFLESAESALKKDQYLFDCSDIDDIITFRKDGSMKVVKVEAKDRKSVV